MSGGGNTVWERLTSNRRGSEATAGSGPKPNDREGVHLYAEFTECLDSYKGHAFAGIAAVTVPLSWYRKSINPIVVGFILGFVPDLIYANWRCDAKYKEFKRHLDAAVQQQQQQQQQQDAKRQ